MNKSKILGILTGALLLVLIFLQVAFAGKANVSISAVTDNSNGSYTLTVNSTSGMAPGDHLGARVTSTTGPGGLWQIMSVPSGISVIVSDTLGDENGGVFGAPQTGTGWYSTPTTTGFDRPPHNALAYDAALRRTMYEIDLLKQPIDASLTDLAGLSLVKGDVLVFNGSNLVRLPVGVNGRVLKADSTATEGVIWGTDNTGGGGGGSPHDLLDGSQNQDTSPDAASRGAIIVGDSAPVWARVLRGATGTVVGSNGTDTTFRTLTQVINDNVVESQGGILYYNGTNWVVLAAGTSGQFLQTLGGSSNPQWATPGATTGGTGQTTWTTGDLLYASGANTLAKRAAGSAGQVLTMSGGVPTWAAASGGLTSPVGPTDGGTGITTYVAGDMLFSSTANVLSRLAVGTEGQVLTVNHTGFPEWTVPGGAGGALYLHQQASGNTFLYTLDADVLDAVGETIEFQASGTNGSGGALLVPISFAGTSLTPGVATQAGDLVIKGQLMRVSSTEIMWWIEIETLSSAALIYRGNLTGITPDLEDGGQALSVGIQSPGVLNTITVIKVGGGSGSGSGGSSTAEVLPRPGYDFVARNWWGTGANVAHDWGSLVATHYVGTAPAHVLCSDTGTAPTFATNAGSTGFPGLTFAIANSNNVLNSGTLPGTGDRSGEWWVIFRPTTVNQNSLFGIAVNDGSYRHGLRITSGAKLQWIYRFNSGTQTQLDSSTTLVANTLYIARVYSDASAVHMEINGATQTLSVVSGSNDGAWLYGGSSTFQVGANMVGSDPQEEFGGQVFRIIGFQGVNLTSDQASSLYDRLVVNPGAGIE